MDDVNDNEMAWQEHHRMMIDMEREIDDGSLDEWLELYDEWKRELEEAVDAEFEAMIRNHMQDREAA